MPSKHPPRPDSPQRVGVHLPYVEPQRSDQRRFGFGELKNVSAAASVSALTLAVMAAPAFGFHHVGLPSTMYAAEAAGSPSDDNGLAKESLLAYNPAQELPPPPAGTPEHQYPAQPCPRGGRYASLAAEVGNQQI